MSSVVPWGDSGHWITFDEARKRGVPEQALQDALCATDEYIFGTSFQKKDPDTGVWMRIDPRDVKVRRGRV